VKCPTLSDTSDGWKTVQWSIVTEPLSLTVFKIFGHNYLGAYDIINDVIGPGSRSTICEDRMEWIHHTGEHFVKISSNSDKNCQRISILKPMKIMMSAL